MKFSEQIKTVRESLGLNQAEAAAILGCGKRTLEHWEAGTRTPLEITQEGAMNRLRATKRPRTRKGQNQPNPMTAHARNARPCECEWCGSLLPHWMPKHARFCDASCRRPYYL